MASVPTTIPPDGFKPWWITPPPHDVEEVAYWRAGMDGPRLAARQSDPHWNVYGVYWAPASALSAPVTQAIN